MALLTELKRRNVFRVATAYLVLAWLVIQVTDAVAPALKLPEWTMSMVVWLGIIGFPFVVVFAWVFELTPQGLIRDEGEADDFAPSRYSTQKINTLTIGLLAAALVFVVVDNYILDNSVVAPAETGNVPQTEHRRDSIAVLPFVNMSDDENQAYFSDGLAEELLNLLARMQGLKVAARTSSFAFRDHNQDVRSIGKALDVATVLEGSVRKSGTRVRITAQLIDVADGYHLWSDTFDRELTDIFAIQDEISAAIVRALRGHLETDAEVAAPVTSIAAYELYLQGRHQARQLKRGSTRKALELFRQANEVDPDFAPAWAARASAVILLRETQYIGEIPRAEAFALAESNVARALALDPLLAEAYVARSMVQWDRYEFAAALESADQATSINPNLAEAHKQRGSALQTLGRIRQAKQALDTAMSLDPLDETTIAQAVRLGMDFQDVAYLELIEQRLTDQLGESPSDNLRSLQAVLAIDIYRLTGGSIAEAYLRYSQVQDWEIWAATQKLLQLKEADDILKKGRNPTFFRLNMATWTSDPGQALEVYQGMTPQQQAIPIVLEELSRAQMMLGDCSGALASLERAHGGQVPIYGQVDPDDPRSNSNLALNRVFCLRQLGRAEEADVILSRVRPYIETLQDNAPGGYLALEAKLLVLDGDRDDAISRLEQGFREHELIWTHFSEPVLQTLKDERRYRVLQQKLDAYIDEERAKLGLPPADLKAADS